MPRTYHCPTQPVPPAATEPLTDPEDALHLALALFHPAPRGETTVIWLGPDRTGRACISVDGAESPDAAVRVARLVAAAAAGGGSEGSAVVLATHRPTWGTEVDDCDSCCFGIIDDLLREAGVLLVEWFLVADGEAVSMMEHHGRRPRWQP